MSPTLIVKMQFEKWIFKVEKSDRIVTSNDIITDFDNGIRLVHYSCYIIHV